MATKLERDAHEVVEQQAAAIHVARRLRQHRTVQRNPDLLAGVNAIYQRLLAANALACVIWFPADTHEDVSEFLPPAA